MYEALSVNRVNAIMTALRDNRELPSSLIFLNRTPLVDATDGEIVARFTGNVTIADIIPDDQKALVRNNGSFTLDQTKIPNIKHGAPITQEMLNLLDRINAGGAIRDDEGVITNYLTRTLDNLLLGVRQRQEQLIIGMARDTVTYDRFGVTFTATFGTPADLKVTPTAWATTGSATPIADIQTQQALGREKYGKSYNRATMTSVAFRKMIATDEFRNKAALYSQFVLPSAATFPIQDMPNMTAIAGNIMGITIELNDTKYQLPNADGTLTSTAFMLDTEVFLSDTSDDNNSSATDFANGVVTESVVAQMSGTNVAGGAFGGPQFGPVAYVTLASPDLNPPGVNCWAVARGFPRKHDLAATSIITIG